MAETSVVITVRDEEKEIIQLLRSIQNQSQNPTEVIFVDGGSMDKTVEMIKSFANSDFSLKVVVANGANRSKGRNIGISAANSDVIACTDAGVVLDRFWLENLTKSLADQKADFVGGVYVQNGESLLQKCIGILQYPNLDKLDASFLPSSRSVAFRKSVWQTVGGYPEYLEKAEDTFFDLAIKEKNFKIALAKDAVVFFPARNSIGALFNQYSSYAEWDVRAHLVSKLKPYRFMFFAYVVLAVLLLSVFIFGLWGFLFSLSSVLAYLALSGLKVYRKTRKALSFFEAAAVKLTIFAAETFGLAKGLAHRALQKQITVAHLVD
jgi:glycosyltransferase involved in cell wall biosynthesis